MNIFDALNTVGGHILVLIGVIGIGLWMTQHGNPDGRTFTVGAYGALMYAMQAANGGGKPGSPS